MVMMIVGIYFTFQDGRSHTAFLRPVQLSFHFTLCLDIPGSQNTTYSAVWNCSTISKEKLIQSLDPRFCLERSCDFNNNFGFVFEEIVVPGHTRKSRCFDTLTPVYIFVKDLRIFVPWDFFLVARFSVTSLLCLVTPPFAFSYPIIFCAYRLSTSMPRDNRSAYHLNGIFGGFFWANETAPFFH